MRVHIIYVIALVIVGIAGFFGGRKVFPPDPPPPIQRDSIIDVLSEQRKFLLDSFAKVSAADGEIIKYVDRWIVKHDTIRPKEELEDIINGLNQVGQYPIPK